MTPEGKVKERVKRLLKKYGAYWFMPVQTGRGKRGLDFHCAYYGKAFWIETKAGSAGMTPLQESTSTDMRQHGEVFLVNDDPGTLLALERWLQRNAPILGSGNG